MATAKSVDLQRLLQSVSGRIGPSRLSPVPYSRGNIVRVDDKLETQRQRRGERGVRQGAVWQLTGYQEHDQSGRTKRSSPSDLHLRLLIRSPRPGRVFAALPSSQLPSPQLPTSQLPTSQLPTSQLETGVASRTPSALRKTRCSGSYGC